MTFPFIEEHKDLWPVRLLCDALEVSPAGYYAWRDARQRPAAAPRRPARGDPRPSTPRSRPATAARASTPSWRPAAHDCCVNTVAKLMRDNGIRAKTARKFRCTTDSNHDLPVADNVLDRQFDPEAPNERGWRTSPTSRRGRAGCTWPPWRTSTRGGWSAGRWPSTMESRLVVDALEMAVAAAPAGRGAAGALGPGQPVRQRALPTPPGRHGIDVQHERRRPTAGTTRRWRAFSPP